MKVLGERVPNLKLLDCSLRLLVVPLSVLSIWLAFTNQQENTVYGNIDFTNLKGFKFMVSVIAYLMVTSGAAMAELLNLAYYGDKKVTWSEACSTYGGFCYRLKLMFALHVIALLCFLVLAVVSAFRVFSTFDPPSTEVEEPEQS